MITVLQRVRSAEVHVGERLVAQIERGVFALVAVVSGDLPADVAYTADRLRHMRIFADPEGRMNLSVEDVGGSILLVSQFTLAANTRRGRRPSFDKAAYPADARRLFDELVDLLESGPAPVQTGEFGAYMRVTLVNDGPATFIVDSQKSDAGARGGAARRSSA